MTHLRPITKSAPESAQLDIALQFVALLNSVVGLIENLDRAFGLDIAEKIGSLGGGTTA